MRIKALVTGIMTAAIALTVVGTAAHAQGVSVQGGDNTTLSSDQTVDGAYYVAGNTITIQGIVNGDVYCAGQTIRIEGKVNGDVICAGQNLTIGGEVTGDVRVAGQTINVTGTIGKGLTAFSQTVTVQKDAKIADDFNGATQDVTLNGIIGRDVLVGSESMTVYGNVGRNLEGEYSRLVVASGATVAGAVNYGSQNKADIAPDTVAGAVNYRYIQPQDMSRDNRGSIVGFALYSLIALLIVGMVLVLIAPQLVHRVSDHAKSRLLMSLLVGFFAVLATPLLAGLIAVTIVGIPLAGLIIVSWILLLTLSGPMFGYYVGRLLIGSRTTQPLLIMLVGSIVLIVSYFVPILNVITLFAAVTIGSGSILLELAKRYKRPTYKVKA